MLEEYYKNVLRKSVDIDSIDVNAIGKWFSIVPK